MEQLLSQILVFSHNFLNSNSEIFEVLQTLNQKSLIFGFFGLITLCILSYLIFKLTLIGIKLTVVGSLIYGAISLSDVSSQDKQSNNDNGYKEVSSSFYNSISEIVSEAYQFNK